MPSSNTPSPADRGSAALSRRSLLKMGSIGAAALGGASALAACSSSDDTAGGSGSGGGGQTNVRMWTWYSEQQDEFPRLVEEFQAANPSITIENRIFGTPDQYLPALAAAVSGGDVPEIFAPHVRALTYGEAGVSADLRAELGEDFLADFFPSTVNAFSVGDKQYAVGWMAQTFGVFYNPDLMAAAGVEGEPETWDDLIAAAQQIKETGKVPMSVSATPATSGLDFFLPLLAQVSGDPTYFLRLDQLDGAAWTDPVVVESLELLKRIVNAGVFQPGINGTSGDQASQLFFTEGAAMNFNGSWAPQNLVQNAPPEFVEKYEVMKFPALTPGAPHYTSNQAGAALAVSANSPAKEAALEFLRFMYSPEQYVQTMNNSNSMPSTASAALEIENPVMEEMTSWLLAGEGVPHIPFGNGSSEAGGPLAAIWDGTGDPAEVAQQMQRAVENARG